MLWYLKRDLQGKTNRTPPYGNGKTIAQWHPWTVSLTLPTFMFFMRFGTMLFHDARAEHFLLYVLVHGLCFLPIKWASHRKIFWIWIYSLLFLFKVREKWKQSTEWSSLIPNSVKSRGRPFPVVPLFNPTPGICGRIHLKSLLGCFHLWGWHQLRGKALSSLDNWTKRNDPNLRVWIIHLLYFHIYCCLGDIYRLWLCLFESCF